MSNRFALPLSILAIAAGCCATFAALAQNTDSSPPPNAISRYRVAGTVVSKIDGHPLDRARVLLRDSKSRQEPQSTFTSQDGKFVFENLKAGKFSLEGTKHGFIPAAYDQHDQFSTAIVTGAGLDTENLILKLSPTAIISGRVLDEAGEPVRHGTVTLYRDNHFQGVDQIQTFRNAQTDDQGAYELTPLFPGTYFLSAHAEPWYAIHPPSAVDRSDSAGSGDGAANVDRALDVAYPVLFYENAIEADGATPIQIRGGEHLQIDMNLNPIPALRLFFHVPANPNHGTFFPQLEQSGFDGSTYVNANPRLVSPGLVELSGVPAGRYNARIPGESIVTQINGIEVNKDGEEVDASTAEALGTVKVSVTVTGEAAIPRGLAVGLIQSRTPRGGFRPISAKGEAEIPQVAAGTYEIRVFGGSKPYAVVGITAEGAQVKGHTVTVPAGASAAVALTLAVGVEVQGVAKKAGKPFAEAMVVLVPKDVAGNRDLFRRDQSDLDGTFSLRAVVPGSYTLVAIEDGWDLDWSRPEIIASYVKRGRPLDVHSDNSKAVEVKEAIEVQQKR